MMLDPVVEINKMIYDREKKKKDFDMSLIKISEKPLIRNYMKVMKVLPLNTIHGLFFITDKNIYFQSIHTV